MKRANTHWTDTPEKFLAAISADLILQIRERTDSQTELAKKLNRTKGRISQTLNNPGNLTLQTMVNYARALGLKISVVLYDDKDDPQNEFGPVHAEIFRLCWEEKNRPRDFGAFPQNEISNMETAHDAMDAASLPRLIDKKRVKTVADTIRVQPTQNEEPLRVATTA